MNDGRYSTFIDMKKMKENGLICDDTKGRLTRFAESSKRGWNMENIIHLKRFSRRMMSSPSLQDEVLVRLPL